MKSRHTLENTVINFDLSKFALKSLFIIDRSLNPIAFCAVLLLTINPNIPTEAEHILNISFDFFTR